MDKIDLEIHKCVLCHNAPCNKLYKNVDPERIIRALRFDNLKGAYLLIEDGKSYVELNDNCNEKCPMNVDINEILNAVRNKKMEKLDLDDVDISSEICGIKLENPFILSSSVVGSKYEMCKRAFEQGWAGVAVKTICLMDMHESSPRLSALKDWDNSFMRIQKY